MKIPFFSLRHLCRLRFNLCCLLKKIRIYLKLQPLWLEIRQVWKERQAIQWLDKNCVDRVKSLEKFSKSGFSWNCNRIFTKEQRKEFDQLKFYTDRYKVCPPFVWEAIAKIPIEECDTYIR